MKILVCVKQICDSEGPVGIDAATGAIETSSETMFRMNRFDEYALEEALRIREAYPETRIDAITVGPERAARTIRRALEMGANEGIHLVLPDECYRTPFEIASFLNTYAARIDYDLILTGVMAEDDMQAQVGPMLAEMLAYPWSTAVIALRWAPVPGAIHVERELEGARREAFEIRLPALLTIQSGINRPRYPALSHVLRARAQPLVTIPLFRKGGSQPVSDPLPRERLVRLEKPVPQKRVAVLQGSPEEKADELLRILRERVLL